MTKAESTDRDQSTSRLGSRITSRHHPPIWWSMVQLIALAVHLPLSLLTGSQSALASRRSVLLVAVSVAVAAMALYLLLSWVLLPRWRALALASVTVVYFWHWNAGLDPGGAIGTVAALVVYAVVAVAAVRFGDRHFFKVASLAASLALGTTLGLMALTEWLQTPDREVGVQDPVEVGALVSTPDIILIVLDGYGRSDVIRDVYGYDNDPFLDRLRSEGFDVAEQSIANYSITHLSLPALLNMSYMHPTGATIGNNDLKYLAGQISGGSKLVSVLKANGYSYIHAESDHWYNVCNDEVDLCLTGRFPDITGHALLVRTPVGGLFYRDTGDPTTALNRDRVDQLTNWEETTRDWPEGPNFAFFHLQLPHPPLYLDSNCDVRLDPELGGRIMNDGEMSAGQLDRRVNAWVEQVECANYTIERLLDQLDEESVVVVVSDHGPDLHFTLEPNPADITQNGLAERFPNLTAVRLPEQCRGSLPDDVDTVNTFRTIVGCLSGEPLETIETQTFVAGFGGPIVELKLDEQNADD